MLQEFDLEIKDKKGIKFYSRSLVKNAVRESTGDAHQRLSMGRHAPKGRMIRPLVCKYC